MVDSTFLPPLLGTEIFHPSLNFLSVKLLQRKRQKTAVLFVRSFFCLLKRVGLLFARIRLYFAGWRNEWDVCCMCNALLRSRYHHYDIAWHIMAELVGWLAV